MSTTQNIEEAATIASEFIYSLDNLPNEIQHLLQEIRHKELRSQELQQEIDKDGAKYIRHQLRAAANSTSVPPSPSPSTPAPNPNSKSHIPAKISAIYTEIDQLASDKCVLAQQIIDLVSRTRARLEFDIAKVRILQGEVVEYPAHHTKANGAPAAGGYVLTGRNPATQITESLRNALATSPSMGDVNAQGPSPLSAGSASAFNGPSNKKRRLNSTTSPNGPISSPGSSTPSTSNTHHAAQQRSRLSRQIHPPRPADDDDIDMDAEGEDDLDGEGELEDEKPYCICQKQSYGDMIACDNDKECPYEWFHLSCVGMKQPTPEIWYCPACQNKGIGISGRKGRKK